MGTYMNCPRVLDKLLEQAGSRRFCARGEKGEPFADLDMEYCNVEEWAPHMWKSCKEATDVSAPSVPWDACWAKQKSTYHQKLAIWDTEKLSKRGKFQGTASIFA